MNNRPDRLYSMMGQFDPAYAVYENSFQQPFPRASGTPPHFDNMGFWYRPEHQEPIFEHNTLLYNQGLTMSNNPLDQPMNIKHRRTRSGCFTCRHRRVKCDETRPICERCKKGNRECQYPQPSSSSRRLVSSSSRMPPNKPPSQESRAGPSQVRPVIEDESEEEQDGSISPVTGSSQVQSRSVLTKPTIPSDAGHRLRSKSDTTDFHEEKGSPRSIETTSQQSRTGTPVSTSNTPPTAQQQSPNVLTWNHVDPELHQYLHFHRERITRYHYFLKSDPDDFIHNELVDMALSFEPLLYAVVGFAAYHHTLGKPNGRFKDFWKYYCRSIELLREWLQSHTERNEAALLTILQLATFEEYLGDWASVASHQKAAYSIFSALYTYKNVMATTTSRCIFDWLARVDVTLHLMGGQTVVLERQWFVTALAWYKTQAASDEQNAHTALPYLVAKLGLIGFDMSIVFSDAAVRANTVQNIQNISKRLEHLRQDIQALHGLTCSSPKATHKEKNPGTAGNLRVPLFQGELWSLNFLWVDWYATEQMHRYQTVLYTRSIQTKSLSRSQSTQSPTLTPNQSLENLPPELEKSSLIQCQLYEAIEKSPGAPYGSVLGFQSSLGLASVFLRKTPKYTMWARRKLANIERMGYVWPPKFRSQMSQLWNDDDVLEWWLPNGEHKTPLLEQIREVVEERNRLIEDLGGDERDDVREIKAVFDKLDFGKRNNRARKDSVWSAAGTEAGRSTKANSAEESSDEESEDELDNKQDTRHTRNESRDSGVDAKTTAPAKQTRQPPLEYANRMSGVWEGP